MCKFTRWTQLLTSLAMCPLLCQLMLLYLVLSHLVPRFENLSDSSSCMGRPSEIVCMPIVALTHVFCRWSALWWLGCIGKSSMRCIPSWTPWTSRCWRYVISALGQWIWAVQAGAGACPRKGAIFPSMSWRKKIRRKKAPSDTAEWEGRRWKAVVENKAWSKALREAADVECGNNVIYFLRFRKYLGGNCKVTLEGYKNAMHCVDAWAHKGPFTILAFWSICTFLYFLFTQ